MATDKKYFYLRLHGPRKTFALDMNDEERALMQKHVAYWAGIAPKGVIVVLGPVMEPGGPWGMCVLEVNDENEAKEFSENDPVIQSNRGFRYEMYPMRAGQVRK